MTNSSQVATEMYAKNYEAAVCHYYSAKVCSSCALLGVSHGQRLKSKLASISNCLNSYGITPQTIHPAVLPTTPWGSRHKVKMSVFGEIDAPQLGIIRSDQSTVPLLECPLGTPQITELLRYMRDAIAHNKLTPYDLATRSGELKMVVVMTTLDHQHGVLRLILRSSELIPIVRKMAPQIQQAFPWVEVITCNIQPVHAAIPEGPEEIVLTEQSEIRENFSGIPLYLNARSFMQVTPEVAAELYSRAAQIAGDIKPNKTLDLYCGVGGFALHIAKHTKSIIGVELSEAAIRCASRSAKELGYTNANFISSDSELFLKQLNTTKPDLLVVNPPRRGLSSTITSAIKQLAPEAVIYSSCNPVTFARDLSELSELYQIESLTPFDMFPLSEHCEVLGYLRLAKPRHSN